MKAGVIRTENMAEERLHGLYMLAEEKRLVSEIEELRVSEGELSDPRFFKELDSSFENLDVLFVAVPSAYAFHVATTAIRLGMHVFLGRSAGPSIAECLEIAALGEEAGVEVGISRMMRFHPFWAHKSDDWRVSALSLLHHETGLIDFQQMLEDAVDLCCSLAGTSEVRGVDAQLIQYDRQYPSCLITGLRFQNGVYAQIQLRQGVGHEAHVVYAGGSFELELDLKQNVLMMRTGDAGENERARSAFESHSLQPENLIEIETVAFLKALSAHQPAPITIVDGMQTLRVVEAIRKNLRP